jgi:hypothetical protein
MRLMSVAPLGSLAVMVKVWVRFVDVAGVAERSVGGCWLPMFQVAMGSQPVPVAALSVIQV